jgi:hypothetical protein
VIAWKVGMKRNTSQIRAAGQAGLVLDTCGGLSASDRPMTGGSRTARPRWDDGRPRASLSGA